MDLTFHRHLPPVVTSIVRFVRFYVNSVVIALDWIDHRDSPVTNLRFRMLYTRAAESIDGLLSPIYGVRVSAAYPGDFMAFRLWISRTLSVHV